MMFLRSRRRTRPASLAILVLCRSHRQPLPGAHMAPVKARFGSTEGARHTRAYLLFLLAGDRLGRTLAGTGVGVGALTAHRQATAMAQTTIAAQIHQALDVHRSSSRRRSPFDHVIAVDDSRIWITSASASSLTRARIGDVSFFDDLLGSFCGRCHECTEAR
jgi:hypothetical protein